MNGKSYFYLLSCLSLLALWLFVIVVPHRQELSVLSTQIDEAGRQVNDFKETVGRLPQFMLERKSLDSCLNQLNSRLYTKEEVLDLFQKLRIEAANRDLVITEITPPIDELLRLNNVIPDSAQAQFLNIGLNISGDYVNFGRFVGSIEQAGYFRGINNCRIAAKGTDDINQEFYFGFKMLLGSRAREGA